MKSDLKWLVGIFMDSSSTLERIHYINHWRNRVLGPFIFLGSVVTVLLLAVLPYRGRIFLALVINILFNRPIIYLNWLSRKIVLPVHAVQITLFYFLFIFPFAALFRILRSQNADRPRWVETVSNTTAENAIYQS